MSQESQTADPGDSGSPPTPDIAPGVVPDVAVDLERFIHHTALPHTRFSLAIDRFLRFIGDSVSWLWIVLVVVIVAQVILRRVFGAGQIKLEELQWWIYAVGFLIGLSYAFQADDHIRVDVLHDRMSLRTQAWVELYGIALLLIPFSVMVGKYALDPFALDSLSLAERSTNPDGLPATFVVKSFLFLGFVLLILGALSRLSRASALLFGAPQAVAGPETGLETGRPDTGRDVRGGAKD